MLVLLSVGGYFMSIDITDIVTVVNKRLQEGASTAQIEKDMKLGKDTLRKRLNRANYKYNGQSRQYELRSGIGETQSVITPSTTNITQKGNTKAIQSVITSTNTNITNEELSFTEDEIKVLKSIAKNYRKTNRSYELNGVIVTRSVRTYKKVLTDFSNFCKENNLSQKDSLALALMDFMVK